jgi:ubiquinone/menaquinone biosynthesis C-methylase UbiE
MPLSLSTDFFDAQALLDAAAVSPGHVVVDVYCGHHGPCTFEAARRVGNDGRVVAVDVRPSAVDSIRARKTLGRYSHVEAIHAHPEIPQGIPLNDGMADAVILVGGLSSASDRLGVVQEAVRLLNSRGCLVVADWHPLQGHTHGPQRTQRVSVPEARSLCVHHGLTQFNPVDVGPYHYAFVARRRS